MDAGFVLPPRKSLSEFLQDAPAGAGTRAKPKLLASAVTAECSPHAAPAPRKGKSWTEEEHLAFLAGLKKLGKGNWRGIARYYVPTRSSTQIASHAQKYLQRISGTTKRKSKFSEIERKVHSTPLADDFRPVCPLPDALAGSPRPANSAPAGMEGIVEAAEAETDAEAGPLEPLVCKPTAVKASSSEPDLLRLAESLISLSDPARTFSSSQQSAFRSAA